MALRSGHGKGRGRIHVEVLPADEQPAGIPAPAGSNLPALPASRDPSTGRFLPGTEASREQARRAGLARAAKARELKMLAGLGLLGVTPESLRPYLDAAHEFAFAEVNRLAQEVGGGVCSPNAAALVQQAALALAASRAAYAAGQTKDGAALGVEVRQNLLAARELCARDAKDRRANQPQQNMRQILGLE